MEKTTQEHLQECEYSIRKVENEIQSLTTKLMRAESELERLYSQKENYLNYLNSDNN